MIMETVKLKRFLVGIAAVGAQVAFQLSFTGDVKGGRAGLCHAPMSSLTFLMDDARN